MGRLVEQRGLEYLTDFAGQYDLGYVTYSEALDGTTTPEAVLVAARAGSRVRVLAFSITSDISSGRGVVLEETTSGLDIVTVNVHQNGPVVLPYCDKGWGQTILGEGIDIRILTGTIANFRGNLIYAYTVD